MKVSITNYPFNLSELGITKKLVYYIFKFIEIDLPLI